MEIILYILLGLVGLVLLFGLVCFILVKTNPALAQKVLGPVGKLMMRSKKVRETSQNMMAQQLAENPEQLEEMAAQVGGREAAKQMTQLLQGRSEQEREELLTTLMQKAESGQQITQQDLARTQPRTPEEARMKAKKKAQSRAKAKAARKQRKRSR